MAWSWQLGGSWKDFEGVRQDHGKIAARLATWALVLLTSNYILTSNVAISGCPSPKTIKARYRALYISFKAVDTRPALWEYNAKCSCLQKNNKTIQFNKNITKPLLASYAFQIMWFLFANANISMIKRAPNMSSIKSFKKEKKFKKLDFQKSLKS